MKQTNLGLLILRIAIGGLMLFHGIGKLLPGGLAPIKGIMESMSMPSFFAYGVVIGEVVAPLMLLAGLRTRLAGGIIAINMMVAMSVHGADLFSIGPMGGYALELQMLYLLGSIVLFLTGGGKYALSKRSRLD